jgi:DNA-binding Lrp family transcriptional regulator
MCAMSELGSKPLFVWVKCTLGQTFAVAEAIMDNIEQTSEVYSIAGKFDLLVKFNIPIDWSIGRFINEKLHQVKGITETETLVVFSAFTGGKNDDRARIVD